MGLLACYVVAIGLFTAPIAMRARDVRFLLAYVMGLWYFVTPVIYPTSYLPEAYRPIAELNPLTAPVELVKYGVLDTAPPTALSLGISLVTLAVLSVAGLVFFLRSERRAWARI
jgi:lipopolysaccharide transport system permease protein